MNDTQLETLDQVRQFLEGTEAVSFQIESKDARYRWLQHTLVKFRYLQLSKTDKGLITRYIRKLTGYSQAQVKRLIRQYRKTGRLVRKQRTAKGFHLKYTREDTLLLAALDERHNTLSGPATKKLCERAYHVFGETEYQRLAGISIAHLYNLRKSKTYSGQRHQYEKTKPVCSKIGERRKPNANGQPGFIRIDSVHQGDQDGVKGVYHINAVDEITQFEVVCTVEKISEHFLIPVLEQLLDTFPFVIKGFHSDNGSEYINKQVAKLLEKLLIEFTKSRARHTNDNALAESKNASIVRKYLGYSHIPQKWAPLINEFNQAHLNPYINYHRPCFFAEIIVDNKGKQRKRYPYKEMMTPYEKLKSLTNAASYLKAGTTFKQLNEIAYQISDNEAAERLQKARIKLFQTIFEGVTYAA
jgi:transposase InsO family protein